MNQKGFASIIIVVFLALLVIVGLRYMNFIKFPSLVDKLNKTTNTTTSNTDEFDTYLPSKTFNLLNGRYVDDVNGFSFKMPEGFEIFPSKGKNGSIVVYVYKTQFLDNDEVAGHLTKDISKTISSYLNSVSPEAKKMEPVESWHWNYTKNIINLGGYNIYYGTTFFAAHDCNSSFHHEIVFALKEDLVNVSISGYSQELESKLPKYIEFSDTDNAYCLKRKSDGVEFDALKELTNGLENNDQAISIDVRNWYKSLNEVVNSLAFTENQPL